MKRVNDRLIPVIVVATTAGIVSTIATLALDSAHAAERSQSVGQQHLKAVQDLSAAFESVAEQIKPSVVSISSVKRIHPRMESGSGPALPPDSPFREFFGEDFFERFLRPRMPEHGYEQRGLGTGVIVSRDGYILTNNHVVDEADEVTVTLSDESQFKATVIGTDPKTDLAVLKINASDLVPATLGNSDHVRIGEWVVAMGHPFGLSDTITAGIVSAKGRANVGVADYEDFIQTDAAINPGNSGGPLADLAGEVIGINTAIFSRSGGYMGIGFAIPSNMAQAVMHSLIDHGRVIRGWLGVAIQDLNKELAESFGFDGTDGVLVSDVTPDGPAATADMEPGDIIVRFNGKRVTSMTELRAAVAATEPGAEVHVEVFRAGKPRTMTVKIGELQAGETLSQAAKPSLSLGMTVENLTPEAALQLGLEHAHGVLVTGVEPFGPAAKAGIRVNDVVVAVQNQPVANVPEFRQAMAKHDLKKGIRLTVRTGSIQRFVFIRSGE